MASATRPLLDDSTAAASSKLLLIDTDVHEMLGSFAELKPYLPPVWRRYVEDYAPHFGVTIPAALPYASVSKSNRQDWVVPGERAGSSLDRLREQLLEGEGVSIALLCGLYHASAAEGNFELWAALASAYNDRQIEQWLDEEPRLRGSVHVVADDPAAAAREIDRVAAHPQIVQVHLPTVTDRQYGHPMYRPIFEAAVRNDLVVSFHHAMNTKTVLGYPRYLMEWHMFAAPHATQAQVFSLIVNGVFEQYPELKVVFLESGVGWVPWFMKRADQQLREFRPEAPWLKRLPSEYMRDHVRLSTQPMGDVPPADFERIVEASDGERIFMYSSDYPHYDADTAAIAFPPSLPDELRRRVYYQNALETYPRLAGIDPAAFA